MGASLLENEDGPAALVNGGGRCPYVLICEHASNLLPKALGTLGLPESELQRHIAWDIGAEKVARKLSRLIDAPLVVQRYSRLAYDCNRPPDSADAMPEISETTHIPGNRNLSPADRLARIREIYRPFHAAIADLLDHRAAEGVRSMVVTIHSFTPVYKGSRAPWSWASSTTGTPAFRRSSSRAFPRGCAPQRALWSERTASFTHSTCTPYPAV